MLTILLFWILSIGQAQETPLVVGLHSQHRLSASAGATLITSNGRVASIKVIGGHPFLFGRGRGQAEIRIGTRILKVFVLDAEGISSFEKLKPLTARMRGLSLSVNSAGPVLGGRLLRLSDWVQIAQVASNVQFQAEIDEDLFEKAKSHFNEVFSKQLLPTPYITFSPRVSAHIGTDQILYKKVYERILGPYGIPVQLSPMATSTLPLVGIKILVTELRKKSFRRLGIRYPTEYSFSLLPTLQPSAQGLTASLEAIEETGEGKILASPHLLCRSGKSAEFLAGGEIPIRISGKESGSVVWKKYGVLLKVDPKADRSGRMSIHISTEISTIDTSQVVDGVPGFLTNKIDSHFDLLKSQTIALSGLIKSETGESSSGLPFLSRIPVLGHLFSSKDYRKGETELVIFVTPRILEEGHAETEEVPHGS